MSRESPAGRSRGRLWMAIVVAGAAGFGAAWLVFSNPLGIPLFEAWSHAPRAAAGAGEEKKLWTCSMHPQVISDEPGKCPICGMDLVPVRHGTAAAPAAGEKAPGEPKILFYRNPMDPTVTSPVPMKDPMGMDYVPVYAAEEGAAGSAPGTVVIDPAIVQNMGVLSEKIARKDLRRSVRTVGYLDYDQEKMVSVTTKYDGFVEKVYVNYIGQPVSKGDPLFDIYSPALVQTEQELLSAIEFSRRMDAAPDDMRSRSEDLVKAARQRLAYWDITPEQVSEIEKTGKVLRALTVTAPTGGLVMKRQEGLEGMAVRPGMDVIHIADLSSLWLKVEVFEDQLAWLRKGSTARVSLTYFPGESFSGQVRFIEPQVSEKTRTVNLTLEVPNADGRLRAGMYATVEFAPVVARDSLAVPATAVLRTGLRNVVIVSLGGGRFAPREVKLGAAGEGWYQVLSGLREGDEVVTSSQFLIDSESNLQEAIQKMVEPGTTVPSGEGD
ncbi:MAG TPA: efflux RND transporter periplasmic adaptor subunit [Candidatus Saccharimonadales bacterium]|nr:efflux RND transporter periplasmic adaptor subunit [Candidatus Saccharimonadales bacterium]